MLPDAKTPSGSKREVARESFLATFFSSLLLRRDLQDVAGPQHRAHREPVVIQERRQPDPVAARDRARALATLHAVRRERLPPPARPACGGPPCSPPRCPPAGNPPARALRWPPPR